MSSTIILNKPENRKRDDHACQENSEEQLVDNKGVETEKA